MQILSSGSFINFENQEKIEQLIFTAKEIAQAAVETDGFVNNAENNKRLALEIWQGAEYMCRDHEEANIKNIFISNFLERLREIGGASKMPNIPPEHTAIVSETEVLQENDAPKDEFLGIVGTNNGQAPEIVEPDFSSKEIAEEISIVKVDFREEKPDLAVQNEEHFTEIAETDEFLAIETVEIENDEGETESATEPSHFAENDFVEPIQAETFDNENSPKTAVSAIVLPEKEPYQFDKCTVTATIQLIPTDTGIRKAVLSVRTHDFAPQISIVEFTGEANSKNLLPALEKAFEKYKNDLPVKVMDKLKREKANVKKQPRNTPANMNVSGVSQNKPVNNQSVQKAEVKTAEKMTPKVTIPKAENSIQGNLFGF